MTVYFLQCGVSRHIKIGYVRDDGLPPVRHSARLSRFAGISASLGIPVRWLAETPGLRFVEAWFHKRHGAAWSGGEWHRPTGALLSDIEVLASGRRLANQPAREPAISSMPCRVARRVRLEYFQMSTAEMADALGFALSTVHNGEVSDAPITRAIDYATACAEHGVALTLDEILKLCEDPERPVWRRFPRYRTYLVRNVGEGARA